MICTPLFGLVVDFVGRRALFMMYGSLLMVPVYLMLIYSSLPLWVPMAMLGIAFSLIPAVMWRWDHLATPERAMSDGSSTTSSST